MSKPQHIFQVYAPSKQILDTIWDIFRNTLWTKSFNEKIIKRTKVAKNRLNIPVQDGGLNILDVQTTAALSMLSSFVSLIFYSISDKCSILSAILHSNPTKHDTTVMFLNPTISAHSGRINLESFFPILHT